MSLRTFSDRFLPLLLLILLLSGAVSARADDLPGTLRVLCYHDIRDRLDGVQNQRADPDAIESADLVAQFSWLQERGYVSVTLDQVLAARAGGAPLPPKAILLTFDDGYRSLYTRVFPLLKVFGFHAVAGLVSSWLEVPAGQTVTYGNEQLSRDAFVQWDEVREMVASGLLEVASHTHDLHHGIQANPQGAMLPAVVARQYDPATGQREDETTYRKRVHEDLLQSVTVLQHRLGRAPRAVIWPYGEYNQIAATEAVSAGMPVGFNLELGPNPPSQPLTGLRRTQLQGNTHITDLILALRRAAAPDAEDAGPERVVHVDLDYVYDVDPVQQERNLDRLVERIAQMHPSTVYLQAFADPAGDGVARALYFPNRHLPMRADLFSRVAWQLRTRARVRVYAWMPVLAFGLPAGHPLVGARVQRLGGRAPAPGAYQRLSPFDPQVRQLITDLYEDLARNTRFAGLLFHDDATLAEDEDGSPDALAFASARWQQAIDPVRGIPDDEGRRRWARNKTDYLDAFLLELAARVRQEQPALLTARNLYAATLLDDGAEVRFAQSFDKSLQRFDYTAVMAMPYLEQSQDANGWLRRLAERVTQKPGALAHTVFELQAQDWRTGQAVPAQTLAAQMQLLKGLGVRHLGYYPDDFLQDRPALDVLKPVFSLERLYRGY